ncbi:MAG: DUF1641 domain-containing protein [Candidatus Hydrothermarchaeaceae archaeon]
MVEETSTARMAEQMNDIHSRLAVIEGFERDETIELLKKVGDSLPVFIELLDTMNAGIGMVKDFDPAIEKISKEVMPNITALRTSLEKEEVLLLLQKFGDNLDSFNKVMDLMNRLQESGNLDCMLNFAEGFCDTVSCVNLKDPKKLGIFGALSALTSGEVRKSLGIMVEIAKNLPGKLKK